MLIIFRKSEQLPAANSTGSNFNKDSQSLYGSIESPDKAKTEEIRDERDFADEHKVEYDICDDPNEANSLTMHSLK